MKVSFNWLKEFVDIPVSAAELADRLSLSGTEVEGIHNVGQGITGVVVGRIESIERHPDADRLVITQVYDGTETHQVVTGATNVFVGAVVPLSKVGASLAGGFAIKASKLRGVPSNGMLCSETELGVATDASGIWILPPDTPLGADFSAYANLADTILEIGILPNRGDCQSMIGIAREVAAIFNLPLKIPTVQLKEGAAGNSWTIQNEAADFCPKYTARAMTGVKVSPSPIWLQRRLQSSGIRPINNVVDISNYVLLECGQPLHIFDSAQLPSGTIGIKLATAGDKITTLDGVERAVPAGIGLITDGTKPVAIAGLMGGESSGVSEHTSTVVIEAAYFQPAALRSAMRQVGLRSESSIRFEKGVDFAAIDWASDRAAALVQELAGGVVNGPRYSVVNSNDVITQDKWISFNPTQINDLLGSTFSDKLISNSLKQLGFEIENNQVKVPSWRQLDIQEWPDLAEEVARTIGLDKIVTRLPIPNGLLPKTSRLDQLREQFSERLVPFGFCEIRSLPMISPEDAQRTGQTPNAETTINNPIAPEESVMSSSHLSRLLNTLAYNQNRQQFDIRLFECGRVFSSENGSISERVEFAGLLTGRETPNDYTEGLQSSQAFRYSQLRSLIETTFAPYKLSYLPSSNANLHPTQQQELLVDGVSIGIMGTIHPQLAPQFDVPAATLYFAVDLSRLSELAIATPKFSAYSKFPSTRRDIAILAPKTLPFSEILSVIDSYKGKQVIEVFLFDCYESEKLGADKRSLAVGLIYQDLEKSLSDSDVNADHQALMGKLTELLDVSIR